MITLAPSFWKIVQTPHKGRGVVATKRIPAGTVIGDYIGRVIEPDDDSDEHGLYGMSWSEKFVIMPDAKDIGLHLVNHSCMPNCGMYPYRGRMLYISLRKIFPGEELLVSYMVEPGADPGGWYTCLCHTPFCRGTWMTTKKKADAFWNGFIRQKQGKLKDVPPALIGKQFGLLPQYPRRVADNTIYDLYGNLHVQPYNYTGSTPVSPQQARNIIRRTGRSILDVKAKKLIVGVQNDELVTKKV